MTSARRFVLLAVAMILALVGLAPPAQAAGRISLSARVVTQGRALTVAVRTLPRAHTCKIALRGERKKYLGTLTLKAGRGHKRIATRGLRPGRYTVIAYCGKAGWARSAHFTVRPRHSAPSGSAAASTSRGTIGQWSQQVPGGDPAAFAYWPRGQRFNPCAPVRWGVDYGSLDAAWRTPEGKAAIDALFADVFAELDGRTDYTFVKVDIPDGTGLPSFGGGFPKPSTDTDILISFMWPTAEAAQRGSAYAQPYFDGATNEVDGIGGPVFSYNNPTSPVFIAMSRVVIKGTWQADVAAADASTRMLVIHETVHALGMDHTTAPGQVMSWPPSGVIPWLQAGDIAGLQGLAHQGCRVTT